MQAELAPRENARTFLTHFVGSGLDEYSDDRQNVRVRTMRSRASRPEEAAGERPDQKSIVTMVACAAGAIRAPPWAWTDGSRMRFGMLYLPIISIG